VLTIDDNSKRAQSITIIVSVLYSVIQVVGIIQFQFQLSYKSKFSVSVFFPIFPVSVTVIVNGVKFYP